MKEIENWLSHKYSPEEIQNFFKENFESFPSEFSEETYRIGVKSKYGIYTDVWAFRWNPKRTKTEYGYGMPKYFKDVLTDIGVKKYGVHTYDFKDIFKPEAMFNTEERRYFIIPSSQKQGFTKPVRKSRNMIWRMWETLVERLK
ncbi:MAG: hypothetical protein AAF740_14230 [Bacteroidota bacterium]